MKFLFLLITALIVYGSLYPFNFEAIGHDNDAFKLIFQTWNTTTYRGDILANIVLFIPFGFVGIQILAHKKNKRGLISFILLFGLVLGVILQFGQLYLPSRDPNLSDAIWNFLGTLIGVSLSLFWRSVLIFSKLSLKPSSTIPMFLVGSWLCYRLMPFIPSIDWAQFKNSVKPLLLHPEFSLLGCFHDSVAWATVYLTLTTILPRHNLAKYIFLGLPIIFFLEVLIIENVVSLTNIAGAVLGIAMGCVLKTFFSQSTFILASLLVISLIATGTLPLNYRITPNTFHWIPFHGFLGGSMLLNISVLFEKFFFYGALLWLLTQSGWTMIAAISIGIAVTLGIEFAQISFGNHTAEITDPILIILLGFGMFKFNSEKDQTRVETTDAITRYSIKLIPTTTILSNQLPTEGIDVYSMPFLVGRFEDQSITLPVNTNKVSLRDYAPFQISRNHFTIEHNNQIGLIIRDNNSRLGTIVNEVQIGTNHSENYIAPLNVGSNEVVAGDPNSKFRFNIVVETI